MRGRARVCQFARGRSALLVCVAAMATAGLFLPGAATGEHARPTSAGSVEVKLVPAFNQCIGATPAGMTHGAPIALPSCGPAAQTSGELTVGTPDSNGQAANSVGSVKMRVLLGNPDTPIDESDVVIDVKLTDVRTAGSLTDYSGSALFLTTLRITQHPAGLLSPSATAADVPLSFPVPCTPTAEGSIGSTCQLTTSADAVLAGSAIEGNRTAWELDDPEILDNAGMRFVSQGIDVP